MNLTARGKKGTIHLRRRVPQRYRKVEPRKIVWISLHTDSMSEAALKAPAAWAEMERAWEARLAGDTADAQARFEAARELCEARGFRFLPPARVARLPLDEIVARVEAITMRHGTPDRLDTAAFLGSAAKPALTVDDALQIFWSLTEDRLTGKSPTQIHLWKLPRLRAVAHFKEAVGGNLALADISPDTMMEFRDWWWDRVQTNDLDPKSANKEFTVLASIFSTVIRAKRLPLQIGFDGLRFRAAASTPRLPFSEPFLRDTLLRPGALDGLNLEARCLILGMVNTGYRPSEGAQLTAAQIRLETDIPYISIEAVGRALKTSHSARIIPLAGVSLEAFRACPGGFPRYADSRSLSNTLNKFLRENKLAETDNHTLYGLRHSFEDRLLDRDVDERIRRDLMGHALNRERYGKGASLEKLAQVVASIAL